MHETWAVVDWRRQVFDLYRRVREAEAPSAAHELWVSGRDRLLRAHPASPVPEQERADYPGADVAAYDPTYRFVVPIDFDVEREARDVQTGTDGVVPFTRLGRVELPEIGAIDLWWLGSYGGGVFMPVRDPDPATYGGGR